MSENRVSASASSPRLPTLMGPRCTIDPAADTPVEMLVFEPAQREKLRAFCDKHKTIPPFALVGLEDAAVPFIGLREYMKIRNLFTNCTNTLAEKNLCAYKAFLLFGYDRRVEGFQARWGDSIKAATLKQVIQAIPFPVPVLWGRIHFRAWGEAFYQHGILKTQGPFRTGSYLMEPVREKDAISLNRTKFALAALPYKAHIAPDMLQEITRLSTEWRLNPNEYKRALKIYASRFDPPGERHCLPELRIDGERFGLPGTTFHALDRNDPLKLFIGNYTGCCERVADKKLNIENTIEHSYLKTSSTFYVVAAGDNIIAHTWAWIGLEGSLCLDGFESRPDSGFTPDVMRQLVAEIAQALLQPEFADHHLVGGLFLGQCAKHLECGRYDMSMVAAEDLKPPGLENIGMNKVNLAAEMAWIL